MTLNREEYDIIFRFLNKANNEGRLVKRIKLDYYLGNQIVKPKDIARRDVRMTKVLYKLPISSGQYIFFEDYPMNIFLNLGFLVGDDEEVLRVKLRGGSVYYTVPKFVHYIEDEIIEQKRISFKDFPHSFQIDFNQPSFIKAIKEYMRKKGVDLSKVHRVKGSGFRCFCPNKYDLDFKVALLIHLPLVRFFDDGFVRDTNIHVDNISEVIDYIKPYGSLKVIEKQPVHRRNNKLLIRDISNEFHLKINVDRIMSIIEKSDVFNISKFKLLGEVARRDFVKLTSTSGEVKAPIWYCSGCYLTFPSVESFEEITGRPFDPLSFDENVLYCKDGYRADFEKKFLLVYPKKYEDKVYFNSVNELIVNLYFNPNVKRIVKRELVKKNEVRQLFRIVKKLIKSLISKSVLFNEIPKPAGSDSIWTKYLYSVYTHLGGLLLKLGYEENVKETIKWFIYKGNFLLRLRKLLLEEDLYSFSLVILRFIEFVKFLDVDVGNSFRNLLNEFFKGMKTKYVGVLDLDLESRVENLLKYINCPFKVYFKDNFEIDLSQTRLEVLKELPPYKFIVKPNKYKIAKDYPKSFRKILEQISYQIVNDVSDFEVNFAVGSFRIKLTSEYFTFYRKFRRFKCVYEDEKIIILKPKLLSFSF